MRARQPAPAETLGDRFDRTYAAASGILVFSEGIVIPEPNSHGPEIENPSTPLTHRSSLYRGSSGFSHLTTQVSLAHGGKLHKLFSITGSAKHPTRPEDFEPTRVVGFRGEENDGDYALSRGWEAGSTGLVLGYLGRAGLHMGENTAERVHGNLTAHSDAEVDSLEGDKRQLLGMVTAGIYMNVEAAGMAVATTESEVILTMLGRHVEASVRAA